MHANELSGKPYFFVRIYPFIFNVDATGPKISFPDNQPTLTKNNPSFKWTSSEPGIFKCALGKNGQVNFVECGNGLSGQWTGSNIPDGAYKFLVYGTDDMKNRGPTAEHKFVVGKLLSSYAPMKNSTGTSLRTQIIE